MNSVEVRFVYYDGDRVMDIRAVTIEGVREGRTSKVWRAIGMLERMDKACRPSCTRRVVEVCELEEVKPEHPWMSNWRVVRTIVCE